MDQKDDKKSVVSRCPKHVLIECLFPNCPFAIKVEFRDSRPVKSQEQVETRMKKHVYKKHYTEYAKLEEEMQTARMMCEAKMCKEADEAKSKDI